jgi:hypothetical protein
MFTGEDAPWKMKHFRVFGSPVFVLAKKLQDGDAIQKWKARIWMGVYEGHSLQHMGNIPVVYNLLTTHISPQFHVIFDDQLTTVPDSASSLPDNFYRRLFQTAKWTYEDTFVDASILHLLQDVPWHHQPSFPPQSRKSHHKALPLNQRRATHPTSHPASSLDEGHPASLPDESHSASHPDEGHPASLPEESHPALDPRERQPAALHTESHPT